MADNTYNKVINFIKKHRMIASSELVAVGVSGGADSVCLLHLLWRMSKEIPFRLLAVHIDHSVREESAQDAAYVERLCGEMKIPFYLKKVDMKGYAKEQGLSLEEAGRQLRYTAYNEALDKYREKEEVCKIAVAHNANDRAETMLFHLFRGSGLKGLCSIQPVRGEVIRPLLCLEREEIEKYLVEQQLEYCHDSTNDEDEYTRNRIRHHILPYAEQEICSGAVAHMGDLADILSETEDYLEKQTQEMYGRYVEEICSEETSPNEDTTDRRVQCICVQCTQLLSEAPAMYKRVFLVCMERLTPHRKDITGQHITDLVKLITKDGSKELSLPYGIRAYKEYDRLILCRGADESKFGDSDKGAADKSYTIELPVEIDVPDEGQFIFTILDNNSIFYENQQNIPENRYTKWFDYDKITTSLVLRKRKQGDYLTIDKALHTKSVKQYMIDEKIPKTRRDNIHILADGSHILWIPGYRISQHYKVDENTKRILRVQLRGGYHGGTN